MASNTFGKIFKIMTWGESHGKAIGVVIDGCPAGIEIHENDINDALAHRAPGKSPHTSPRMEDDKAEILSGVFEGKTTGTPISILIPNKDADSSKYEPIKHLLRPGHANYTYLEKYGVFDYRGGGRASARETACRVAAGAIAKKFIISYGIKTVAYVKQIGPVVAVIDQQDIQKLRNSSYESVIYCPDPHAAGAIISLIKDAKKTGDSLGGVIEFFADFIPVGLGDPVYDKLEAALANAMLSIPATKGFEIGSGFQSACMQGSDHNDQFVLEGSVRTKTNYAGGVLGGISTGMPIIGRVAFKPTSSIRKPQETLSREKEKNVFQLPEGSRHDPCVAIRAVPVVESMLNLVLADLILSNRSARL